MRQVINISLPVELANEVDKMVKRGKFATKSEFVREIIRERILDSDLLARVQKSKEEIASGKGEALDSFCDLR